MSNKLKHFCAVVMTMILVITFLPFTALVRADSGSVYFFYRYDYSIDEDYDLPDGLARTIPSEAKRIGVYVDGGSYTASPEDYIIIANNATISALTQDLHDEEVKIGLAGKSTIITKGVTLRSDLDAYDNEVTTFDVYNISTRNENYLYSYEFTSDYNLDYDIFPKDLIVDLGSTLTIKSHHVKNVDGIEYNDGTTVEVEKDVQINGTLAFESLNESIVDQNILRVYGNLRLGSSGSIVGGDFAKIETYGTHNGLVYYSYNNSILSEDSAAFSGEYNASLNKWLTDYSSGVFHVTFEPFSNPRQSDGAGAFVTVNGKDVIDGQYFVFEANKKLTFTLVPPSERSGENPLVTINTYDSQTITPSLSENNNIYTFTYTPVSNTRFSIDISWSEFDRIVVNEDQFMVDIELQGSLSCNFTPAGSVYNEPHNTSHKKVIFNKSVLTNGVSLEITPAEGCDLRYVNLNEGSFETSTAITHVDSFSKHNNTYLYKISNSNYYGDYYLCFESNDRDSVLPENELFIYSDIDCENYQNRSASVYLNGELLECSYTTTKFKVNESMQFVITPPIYKRIKDVMPYVEIIQGNTRLSSYGTGNNKLTLSRIEGKDPTYSFSYTPTSNEGLRIRIYWDQYDAVESREGDKLFTVEYFNQPEGATGLHFVNTADQQVVDPFDASRTKYLFRSISLPANGFTIELDDKIERISLDGDSYVRDDLAKDEGVNHFSDLNWFSEKNGKTILTIPSDCDNYLYISVYYDDYTDDPEQYTEGHFNVVYDDRFDKASQYGIVRVNGKAVETGMKMEFTAGEPLNISLEAPSDRQNTKRIVKISGENYEYSTEKEGSEKIVVTNDSFSFTPTSNSGFSIEIIWSEYDAINIEKGSNNLLLETATKGNGSVSVSNYELRATDPYYTNEDKYIIPQTACVNGGTVVVSLIPIDGAELKSVNVFGVTFVEKNTSEYPYESLMSSDSHFSKENGIWRITLTDNDLRIRCIDVTAVFSTVSAEPAQVKACSIALEDKVGVNFKVALPDAFLTNTGAYAEVNGVVCAIGEKDSQGRNVISYGVAAAQMRDKVVLKLHRGDGSVYPLLDKSGEDVTETGFEYSVMTYVTEANKPGSGVSEDTLLVLKRMQDFGKYAQAYFNYKPDEGAYSSIVGDVENVETSMLKRYEFSTVTADGAGITRKGSSLALEAATEINHKFKLDTGKKVSDYRFYVDGKEITTSTTGTVTLWYNASENIYVISIKKIASSEMQIAHEVVVKDKTTNQEVLRIDNFSALSYAYAVLSNAETNSSYATSKAKLVSLVKAMYLYNRAAMVRFGVTEPAATASTGESATNAVAEPEETQAADPEEKASEETEADNQDSESKEERSEDQATERKEEPAKKSENQGNESTEVKETDNQEQKPEEETKTVETKPDEPETVNPEDQKTNVEDEKMTDSDKTGSEADPSEATEDA